MKTLAALTNTASFTKKGLIAAAVAAATMTGSAAYADDHACLEVAEKKVAVEAAQLQDDWSEIFTSQAALMTAKTECFIDENMTKENAKEQWADIKADFQDGMEDLHDEFDEQVENAKDAYEEAKDEAETDEALEEAEETYDDTMEEISESYNSSVATLKEKLGIDE